MLEEFTMRDLKGSGMLYQITMQGKGLEIMEARTI